MNWVNRKALSRASSVEAAVVAAMTVAAVALVGWVGVDPVAGTTAGLAHPASAGSDVIVIQVLENLTRLLDRVADFLNQLDRVLSEFVQLFGGSGSGGDG